MGDYNYYAPPRAALGGGLGGSPYALSPTHSAVLAGRGARFGAFIVDILSGLFLVVPMMLGLLYNRHIMIGVMVSGGVSVALIVVNLYLLAANGQSLGKRIMGIKVVRADLVSKASLWRILFLRYFSMVVMGLVPGLGLFLQIGNFIMIFGADQRCGHDYIADTHVVVDQGGEGGDSGDAPGGSWKVELGGGPSGAW